MKNRTVFWYVFLEGRAQEHTESGSAEVSIALFVDGLRESWTELQERLGVTVRRVTVEWEGN
jgi:hypothetical protein